mmetsp:Transcript_83314/g.165389  ORF Transcript_83314/g.165389 Transcript_83314/m.165389 type:complete len:232 (+) Transcript_83314:369-1064(+)
MICKSITESLGTSPLISREIFSASRANAKPSKVIRLFVHSHSRKSLKMGLGCNVLITHARLPVAICMTDGAHEPSARDSPHSVSTPTNNCSPGGNKHNSSFRVARVPAISMSLAIHSCVTVSLYGGNTGLESGGWSASDTCVPASFGLGISGVSPCVLAVSGRSASNQSGNFSVSVAIAAASRASFPPFATSVKMAFATSTLTSDASSILHAHLSRCNNSVTINPPSFLVN